MTATTYRAEVRATGEPLNRRGVLVFASTGAGTGPRNPLHVGLGARVEVVAGSAAVDVLGRLIYPPAGEVGARAVSFVPVPGAAGRWAAEGAVGGARLGFPERISYDLAQPFELEVSVVFRGGRLVSRHAFWVGSSRHATCLPCDEREPLSIRTSECCYNGQGFRSASNRMQHEAAFGEYDHFFQPGVEFPFAVGLLNQDLELVCDGASADDLLNPYLPDSITGVPDGLVDDPFADVAVSPARPAAPYDALSPLTRLREDVDGTVAETGVTAGRDVVPRDRFDQEFAAPPGGAGHNRLSPLSLPLARVRPMARRTGRLRAHLGVRWLVGGLPTYEASVGATPAPLLLFDLTGFDPGERVFLVASTLLPEYEGPEPDPVGPAVPPLGVSSIYRARSMFVFRRRAGAGPPTLNLLMTGLGVPVGEPSFALAPAMVTGTPTWKYSGTGPHALIGTPGSLTFSLPVDVAYLQAALGILEGTSDPGPEAALPLYFQGIVVRPGGVPLPSNGPGGTGALFPINRTNADFPHASFLTNVAELRYRA